MVEKRDVDAIETRTGRTVELVHAQQQGRTWRKRWSTRGRRARALIVSGLSVGAIGSAAPPIVATTVAKGTAHELAASVAGGEYWLVVAGAGGWAIRQVRKGGKDELEAKRTAVSG